MKDVIMEEVWKRREQMLQEHGGMEGLLKHIARLEAERLQAEKRRRAKAKKRKASTRVSVPTPAPARGRRVRPTAQPSSTR